jgi:hypothetical protein
MHEKYNVDALRLHRRPEMQCNFVTTVGQLSGGMHTVHMHPYSQISLPIALTLESPNTHPMN